MPDALDKQQDMCLLCICAAACGAMHHVRPGANGCDHVAAAPPMTVLESSTGTLRCAALALPGVAADNHTHHGRRVCTAMHSTASVLELLSI